MPALMDEKWKRSQLGVYVLGANGMVVLEATSDDGADRERLMARAQLAAAAPEALRLLLRVAKMTTAGPLHDEAIAVLKTAGLWTEDTETSHVVG